MKTNSTLQDWIGGFVPEPTGYTTATGTTEPIYVFPAPDAGAAKPALVWIHGGGWRYGDPNQFFPNARYFASRGTVGFSIDYRRVGGAVTSISDCIDDCRSAVRHIRANAARFGIDPNRVVVLGDSAGGHLAAALGTIEDPDETYSSKPDAMVLYNPIVDFVVDDPQWFPASIPDDFPSYGLPLSEATDDLIEHAKAISPICNIRKGQPPALLIHGIADSVVKVEQARRFAAAMEQAGNRCDLILLPGVEHAFALTGYSTPDAIIVTALLRTDEFLQSLGYIDGSATIEMPKE